jgi:hypothetical protein
VNRTRSTLQFTVGLVIAIAAAALVFFIGRRNLGSGLWLPQFSESA